ncbi:hypothetical protein KIPB_006392 [Kipferlia bialata]|uniref:Uncharacterized protein n=1 Tax=Kipferlia bialata TaxID=797122 RepID=A0A9K3GJ81_9EUKA|nr:hypothetical protein KIPB_006392 [Kipferlia bialata]|eukprot:g6392.t1
MRYYQFHPRNYAGNKDRIGLVVKRWSEGLSREVQADSGPSQGSQLVSIQTSTMHGIDTTGSAFKPHYVSGAFTKTVESKTSKGAMSGQSYKKAPSLLKKKKGGKRR